MGEALLFEVELLIFAFSRIAAQIITSRKAVNKSTFPTTNLTLALIYFLDAPNASSLGIYSSKQKLENIIISIPNDTIVADSASH